MNETIGMRTHVTMFIEMGKRPIEGGVPPPIPPHARRGRTFLNAEASKSHAQLLPPKAKTRNAPPSLLSGAPHGPGVGRWGVYPWGDQGKGLALGEFLKKYPDNRNPGED